MKQQIKEQLQLAVATTLEQVFVKEARKWKWLSKLIKEFRGWTERQLERWKMTPELRRWVYKEYGRWCLRCLKEKGVYVFADQIDHVVSLFNGGKTVKGNLQPLCGPCNRWKGKKNIDYRPS